jgi:hypothetical protein
MVNLMKTESPDEVLEPDNNRSRDPFLDRRSGDDRRTKYSLTYFSEGGLERRAYGERRKRRERRKGYIRISPWTSVGPFNE